MAFGSANGRVVTELPRAQLNDTDSRSSRESRDSQYVPMFGFRVVVLHFSDEISDELEGIIAGETPKASRCLGQWLRYHLLGLSYESRRSVTGLPSIFDRESVPALSRPSRTLRAEDIDISRNENRKFPEFDLPF